MEERAFDVVLFGATGFTGRLTAEYLARTYGGTVRWAIAGRNRDKLADLKRTLVAIDEACESVGVVVADTSDDRALEAMAADARAVLTTAGPFVRHGEPVARACVLRGANYADLTGEPEYVDLLRERYHELARDKGLRIVNCCGFDSVPADLGVLYTVRELPDDVPIEIEGFVRARGKPSGGTWNSALGAFGSYLGYQRRRRGGRRDEGVRPVGRIRAGIRHVPERGGWAVPMPTIDPAIVLRSASALPGYGSELRYGHYAIFPSLASIAVITGGVAGAFAASQLAVGRELLGRLRPPGEGPDLDERAKSWFEITFVARAGGRELVTRVRGGDPGYDETAKMAAESALSLALDTERLGLTGVITPAMAMGEVLLARLSAAGLRFETLA